MEGSSMIQYQNESITIFQSQLYKTTSTVIRTDDCIIVVDPTCLPNEIAEIRAEVDRVKGNRPIYLFFTHSDWDHIIGYGAFPEAVVIASKALHNHPNQQEILDEINTFDDSYYIDRDYKVSFPQVDIVIEKDAQEIMIGDNTKLTFYLAPGHTNDSIFAVIEPLGIWLAGDYLSDVEFPYIYFSSEAYINTLEKTEEILRDYSIDFFIPGHGKFTTDTQEILRRKNKSLHYITQLKIAIQTNTSSDYLFRKYDYLISMKHCHEQNKLLMKQELDC